MQHSDLICVKKAKGKGRGVFALKFIPKGTIIERVPIIVLPSKAFVKGMKNKHLNLYFFIWGPDKVAMSLGYGSIYNHSYEPNARYIYGRDTLSYKALRDIRPGEEIVINYNYFPKCKDPMDFDVL
jgi:SET domain-containing protein